PTNAFAASNKTKIAALLKQLKKLPNQGAGVAKVQAIVQKLAKLDPAKANTYLKAGLSKLNSTATQSAVDALTNAITKIVSKSNLPDSKKQQIAGQIQKTIDHFTPPTPTPTPYQAMLLNGEVVA
ncbi:MAG TPA: hypothetical protein V6C72_19265, partial [Chroococcales cyanobacterium]